MNSFGIAEPAEPWLADTRFRRWWIASRAADLLLLALTASGAVLFFVVLVDAAASWPSDWVILAPGRLEALSGWLLIPGWAIMLGSLAVLEGWGSGGQRQPTRLRVGFLARRAVAIPLGALAGFVVVLSAVKGETKGEVRVAPGPQYEVSLPDLNDSDWTTVSFPAYQRWEARVVRGDAVLVMFGAAEFVVGIGILGARRVIRVQLTMDGSSANS